MIAVLDYKAFWEYIAAAVQGITSVKTVGDIRELEKFLKDMPENEVNLIAVLPSSDTDYTNLDNKQETDNSVVYLLKKTNASDMTENDLLMMRVQTQQQMTAVKEKLYTMAMDMDSTNKNILMARRLQPLFHTDPEYDFLGCNGWSISFKWKTNAYDNAL
jgi:hypothetical protein